MGASHPAKFFAIIAGALVLLGLGGCGILLATSDDSDPPTPPGSSPDAAIDTGPDGEPIPDATTSDAPLDAGVDSHRSWFENFDDAATNVDPNFGFVSLSGGGTRTLVTTPTAFSLPNSLELTGENRLRRSIPNVRVFHAELEIQGTSAPVSDAVRVFGLTCDHNTPMVSVVVDSSYHLALRDEVSATPLPPMMQAINGSWVRIGIDATFSSGTTSVSLSIAGGGVETITILSDCGGPSHVLDADFGSHYAVASSGAQIDFDDVAMTVQP